MTVAIWKVSSIGCQLMFIAMIVTTRASLTLICSHITVAVHNSRSVAAVLEYEYWTSKA